MQDCQVDIDTFLRSPQLIEQNVRLFVQGGIDAVQSSHDTVVALVPEVFTLKAPHVGVVVTAMSRLAFVHYYGVQVVDVILEHGGRVFGTRVLVDGGGHVVLQVEFLGVRDHLSILLSEVIANKVDHENFGRRFDGPRLLGGDLLIASAALVPILTGQPFAVDELIQTILEGDSIASRAMRDVQS